MDTGDKTVLAILAGGAFGVGVFWWQNREEPGSLFDQLTGALGNLVTRGKRLSHGTTDDGGDIVESPEELTAQAAATVGQPVTLHAYSLARMLASEEERANATTKTAIAWVALNEANRRGVSITDLLLRDNGPGNGRFGQQRGRYASTATDPYEGDLQVAESILSGVVADITNGAIHFFRPELQNRLYDMGKTSKTAAEIDAAWGGNGFSIEGAEEGLVFYT